MARFSYCFISPEGSDYPPILTRHSIEAGESQTILGKGGAVKMTAFLVQHGQIPALGYRIGNAAYTPDLNDIPRESWGALENLDLWIVDGLRYITHSSHFSINDALSWIERFKPKRAVITNMNGVWVDRESTVRKLEGLLEPHANRRIGPGRNGKNRGVRGIKGDGSRREVGGFGRCSRFVRHPAVERHSYQALRKGRERFRVGWIERHRATQQGFSLHEPLSRIGVYRGERAEEQVVGVQVVRRLPLGALNLGQANAWFDRYHHRSGDPVL